MRCTRKPAGPVHQRSGAGAVPTTMLACIATVLWFVAPLCGAKDLIDETWIELRSPHLVVVSALSEARTAVLAQSLEKFRIAVALIPDVGRLPPTRLTRIYLLPFTSATLDFSNRHRAFASLSPRGNDIAILDSQGGNDELLKHFYAHGLIQGTNDVGSPRWLDEGIAQLLSSVHVRGTAIDIGDILVRNGKILGWGGWMPFTSLLEAHGPAHLAYWHRDQFYAQSWLLMHYLMLGRKDIDFPAQVRRYLTISRAGTARVPAFEQAFGLRVEDLRQILRVYMRDLSSGALSIAQPLADAAVIVRPLPQDEIAAELGRLKTVYGRYDEAQPLFGASLALNPRNTTALIGTGDHLTRGGKVHGCGAVLPAGGGHRTAQRTVRTRLRGDLPAARDCWARHSARPPGPRRSAPPPATQSGTRAGYCRGFPADGPDLPGTRRGHCTGVAAAVAGARSPAVGAGHLLRAGASLCRQPSTRRSTAGTACAHDVGGPEERSRDLRRGTGRTRPAQHASRA